MAHQEVHDGLGHLVLDVLADDVVVRLEEDTCHRDLDRLLLGGRVRRSEDLGRLRRKHAQDQCPLTQNGKNQRSRL